MTERVNPAQSLITRRDTGVMLLLCLVHLGLYLLHFDDSALFQSDAERDLTNTLSLVNGGAYPIRGPHLGDTQFFVGSLYYLLLSIPMLITHDPVLLRGFFVLLGTGALALLYRFLRRWVRLEVAALALCLLMASGYWFESLRQIWHSTLVPIFLVTWLWLITQHIQRSEKRWFVLAAIPMAICVQLHATMITLPVVMGVLLVLHARRLGWKAIAGAIALGALVAVPLWMALYASQYVQTAELDWWIEQSRSATSVDVLSYLAWATIPGWGMPSAHAWLSLPYGIPAVGFLIPALAVVGGAWALRTGPSLTLPRVLIVLTVLGVGVQFVVLSRDMNARYLHANFIPLLMLGALGLERLLQRTDRFRRMGGRLLLVLGGVVLLAGFVRDPTPRDRASAMCGMVAQRDIAETLSADYGLHEDELNTRLHGMPCRHRASGYAYFYRVQPPSEAQRAETKSLDRHLFVMPADVPLTPSALEVFEARTVGHGAGAVRVTAYRPAIQYAAMTRTVQHAKSDAPAPLPEAGRRSLNARAGTRSETLRVPIHAGPESVFVRFWQGMGSECAVQVQSASAGPLTARMIPEASRHGERLFEVTLGAHANGTVEVIVGPCADFDALEIF